MSNLDIIKRSIKDAKFLTFLVVAQLAYLVLNLTRAHYADALDSATFALCGAVIIGFNGLVGIQAEIIDDLRYSSK